MITLYRYTGLCWTKENNYTIEDSPVLTTLLENKLYLSIPNNFNDPFDGQIFIDENDSFIPQEIFEYWKSYYYQHSWDKKECWFLPKKEEFSELFSSSDKQIGKINCSKWINRINENLLRMGVCCLSKNWDSTPMLGYYADKFQGIVLEYDLNPDQLEEEGFLCGDVNYTSYKPRIPFCSFLSDPRQTLIYLMFTKHISWSHEKEFRLVHRDFYPDPVKKKTSIALNNSMSLKSISFHSSIEQEQTPIIEFAKRMEIKAYKIETNFSDFSLIRKNLDLD